MPFSDEIKSQAWTRAGGKCQCMRTGCGHVGRCNAPLLARAWDAHHIQSALSSGADTLANCEALCLPCHNNTQSYGRT